MDVRALYKFQSGLYVVSAKAGEDVGACITNTGLQLTSQPLKVEVVVNKQNHTESVIEKAGHFALTVVTESANMMYVGRFGFRTSLDYDKFDGIVFSSDEGLCKPEEKFFRTVVERYNLDIRQSIMIGNDAGTDILGANTIGMDSLYIHSDISPMLTDPTGADIPATYRVMDGDFTKIKTLIL